MLSQDKIISIFCFIDDLLKSIEHEEDNRRSVSDSEIVTTAIISSPSHRSTFRCITLEVSFTISE